MNATSMRFFLMALLVKFMVKYYIADDMKGVI